MGVTVTSAHS